MKFINIRLKGQNTYDKVVHKSYKERSNDT